MITPFEMSYFGIQQNRLVEGYVPERTQFKFREGDRRTWFAISTKEFVFRVIPF